MRVNVTLACTECGDRNYITKKNKRNNIVFVVANHDAKEPPLGGRFFNTVLLLETICS